MNKDYKARSIIIYGDENADSRHSFDSLSLKQLDALITNDFIHPHDCHNYSPSVSDFMEFMKKYTGVVAIGHTVGPERSDYRVSLEGLRFSGEVSKQMLLDFVDLCRRADEFAVSDDSLYAWWD